MNGLDSMFDSIGRMVNDTARNLMGVSMNINQTNQTSNGCSSCGQNTSMSKEPEAASTPEVAVKFNADKQVTSLYRRNMPMNDVNKESSAGEVLFN